MEQNKPDQETELLENEVKALFEALDSAERSILVKLLAAHEAQIHVKSPEISSELVRVIEGDIK